MDIIEDKKCCPLISQENESEEFYLNEENFIDKEFNYSFN